MRFLLLNISKQKTIMKK